VVAVKATTAASSAHRPDRSNTGATLYIEPDELVELSNDLEDAVFEEKKRSPDLWTLTKLILDQQEASSTASRCWP